MSQMWVFIFFGVYGSMGTAAVCLSGMFANQYQDESERVSVCVYVLVCVCLSQVL